MSYKLLIFRSYLLLKILGERALEDPRTDFLAARGERFHVLGVERGQPLGDARLQLARGEEFAERPGGRGEASRHADPGRGEDTDHLAERGILAADPLEVGHAQIFKP